MSESILDIIQRSNILLTHGDSLDTAKYSFNDICKIVNTVLNDVEKQKHLERIYSAENIIKLKEAARK